MKYSCCIEMIYTQYPFCERIYKAAEAGFDFFEFWNWQEKDIPGIQKAMADTGIGLASFQGSLNGVMVDKNDADIYVADVRTSIDLAAQLEARAVFCISDILQEDRSVKPHPYHISEDEGQQASINVLKTLAPYAEQAGVNLVIEPLNTKVDHAGYSLSTTLSGVEIVKAVDSPRVKLLYDAYHMQIMEGNIIDTIKENVQHFGHFHIADVPGRCQPGTGELNYVNVLSALKKSGYAELVGFEFTPSGKTDEQVIAETLAMLREI